MSTPKQIAANRRNGGLSQGPKTTAGKKRSRYNALKHGLAAQIVPDEFGRQRIEALAWAFAGQINLSAACGLAEAQVELQRVWAYRAQLLGTLPNPDDAGSSAQEAQIMRVVAELEKLLRYERRALAKRNKAIKTKCN